MPETGTLIVTVILLFLGWVFEQIVRVIVRSELRRALRGYVINGTVQPQPRDRRGRFRKP